LDGISLVSGCQWWKLAEIVKDLEQAQKENSYLFQAQSQIRTGAWPLFQPFSTF
jgi:hypothetical protein